MEDATRQFPPGVAIANNMAAAATATMPTLAAMSPQLLEKLIASVAQQQQQCSPIAQQYSPQLLAAYLANLGNKSPAAIGKHRIFGISGSGIIICPIPKYLIRIPTYSGSFLTYYRIVRHRVPDQIVNII